MNFRRFSGNFPSFFRQARILYRGGRAIRESSA